MLKYEISATYNIPFAFYARERFKLAHGHVAEWVVVVVVGLSEKIIEKYGTKVSSAAP